MKLVKLLILCSFIFSFFSSCAPVKFSKADSQVVGTDCEGISCSPSVNSINCSPRINNSLLTYTYNSMSGDLPGITSNCNPSDVDYVWTVKKPDSTVITIPISGLTGANPSAVNLTLLGQGTYYVFLNAAKTGSGLNAYSSSNPLEFVVPGAGVGNSLTCDPKLNGNLTSVIVNSTDNDPTVTANCVPMASTYIWTAKKDGVAYTVTGLSGASSAPNFKSLGAGTYELYLYATLTGSTHWKSAAPLTVRVVSPPPPMTNIQCNPRINGSLTDLTITSSAPNPLISANCLPTGVQYTWSVTKNGTALNIPALTGANSNPNFAALGKGTYLISLMASAPSYLPWNTTTPLKITVEDSPINNLTLNCSPRLNNIAVAVTVAIGGANPLVTSGCVPTTVTHTWSVFKTGQAVAIAGLAGASSTGQFIQAGLGTYYIYLTASAPGYNTYVSPSPLEVTVANANNPYRDVIYEKLITVTNNKVDILLVVDDSKSMEPENTKLAQKLQAFVADLKTSGLDWQMCATVTRDQDVEDNGKYYWAASRFWTGYIGSPQWILNAGAINPYSIFTDTMQAIGAGWAGTDDERGIKAAWWSFEYATDNFCYRTGASIAVVLISDEDERSIGGNQNLAYYDGEFKNLEADDQPQELINKVKQKFGVDKRFTFNSIIVKPGDSACMTVLDAGASKSHYGYKYAEVSQLSGGYVGNICDADYSQNLYYFKDKIINSAASFPLECAPVGPVTVTITSAMSSYTTTIVNNTIVFNPAIPAGRTVKLQYKCSTM